MQTSFLVMLILIVISGAIGGATNAVMTDNGFLVPKQDKDSTGNTIWRPGVLGNVFIGAVAAFVSWGLYGPLSSYFIVGTTEALALNTSPENVGLSLASLAGALLVGIGGARWLSNEIDKNLLRATAVGAAGKPQSSELAQTIALGTPGDALAAVVHS